MPRRGRPAKSKSEEAAAPEVAEAPVKKASTPKPAAGKPLPDGFKNPEPGKPGHLCVDPKGRYRPDWSCVFIHKTQSGASEQAFLGENLEQYYVKTGVWADVPPSIVNSLQNTVIERVDMRAKEKIGLSTFGVEKIVETVPRFQYNIIPSS